MTTTQADSQSNHWSDYWSRGCLTSLPQDFASNYDGEVAVFWQAVFHSLQVSGRMLDVCTGNGAIALLAAEFCLKRESDIEIVAVDAASISTAVIAQKFPEQAELLQRITFISDTRIEDLALPTASFDLVTSQYGIEYCDWDQAATQVYRLLKPGGQLVMVNHTASSDIMRFMEQEHQEYSMLEKSGFFSVIGGYLLQEVDYNTFRATLEMLHANLTKVLERGGGPPLFQSVHGMLSGVLALDQLSLDERRTHLESYYIQARHGFDRLADMLRVNHAIASNPEWFKVFESAGLQMVDSGEIRYQQKHHAGGFLKFIKPDQEK
ncbi:MAG: ubiquinone/menaquinone biosynthesis C-methylase UbiE [Lysobacterales bacterium]|jgi:ubiquinone/menaquinone biosynthesis C-methylase UbiE